MKALKALAAVAALTFPLFSFATPVNINTATAEELAKALNGVGQKKAEAIVAWRTEHGPFTSAEQLSEVKGIGEALIARNKDDILLQDSTKTAQ
ncbi:competence protein ComEA [Pokkaliibacter plantistimulans]|uniref:Competence protein ComEA n=1 Tax=Proteobacteria bacterium 228 TaxID=2083153 RepID=A0A2S5KI30_9PROT|nr:helix-hairpin-helix domain-containing protein [Pokkaliibacter plantistimulans]PPC74169.1 competence protein ComEA [Pokkaliibacter plantistimulans]